MSEFSNFTQRNHEWQKHASKMSEAELQTAKAFQEKGWIGNYGSAVYVGGVYYVTLEGAIENGFPPPYWLKMSPREKATHSAMSQRTRDDYLQILVERPDPSFGEMDNIQALLELQKDGLIEFDDTSKITSMFTYLKPHLTDAGRKAAAPAKRS